MSNTRTIQINQLILSLYSKKLSDVRNIINRENVNNVIDERGYTALHCAVSVKSNTKVINYLLSCGANPSLKTKENQDAYDISVENNYRILFDETILRLNEEIDNLSKKLDDRTVEVRSLKSKKEELEKLNIQYVNAITEYKRQHREDVNTINYQCSQTNEYKRKFEEAETAFNNLYKKRHQPR